MKKILLSTFVMVLSVSKILSGNVAYLPSDSCFIASISSKDRGELLKADSYVFSYECGKMSFCGYRGAFKLKITNLSEKEKNFIVKTYEDENFFTPDLDQGTLTDAFSVPPKPLILFYNKEFDIFKQSVGRRLNSKSDEESQLFGEGLQKDSDLSRLVKSPSLVKGALSAKLYKDAKSISGLSASVDAADIQIIIVSSSTPFLNTKSSPEGVQIRRLVNGVITEYTLNKEGKAVAK